MENMQEKMNDKDLVNLDGKLKLILEMFVKVPQEISY
jgi:hypothetical protein